MSDYSPVGMLALGVMLAFGCNDVSGPADPGPTGAPGALEVSVAVSGTRPDPDGYFVVVSVDGISDRFPHRVESSGGTVRFADLPLGDHSVRLESLAANCSVKGDNPRPFTIAGGETSRIWFAVSCPGPTTGAISGTVTIDGSPLIGGPATGSDGNVMSTAITGADGTFTLPDLPPGEYTVGAKATGISCSDRSVKVRAGATTVVDILCVRSSDFSGGAGIYIADADGSGATWLTSGNRPAWSPDGLRIAFDRDGQIYVIDADGSKETALNRGLDPAWSPDGMRIVFADPECTSPSCSVRHPGISVMNADGSNLTGLIGGDFIGSPFSIGVGKPAWSPDGETIAFNHLGDGEIYPAQIYLMNADGSEPRRLTTTDGRQYAESDPSWSPDGSGIALWSYGYGIATVSANGGIPRTVYANFPFVHYGAKPVWSPDRNTIAFTAARIGNLGGPFIYVVDSWGGQIRLLMAGGYDPAWSPDGAHIAFFVHGTLDE